MRTIALTAGLALLLLAADATVVAAQDRPDFTGAWTLVETTGGPEGARTTGQRPGGAQRGGGMLGIGQEATISQDDATLTMVRQTPQGESRMVYNLDGSESRNVLGMGGQRELVSRASWDGATLVIVTPIELGGFSVESRMTMSLDDDGRLVVSTTRTGGPGPGGTTTSIYTRQS